MFTPTLEEMKALPITDENYIPIKKEIYADLFSPISVLKKLKSVSDHCFILESHEDQNKWGRYSFIGCNPKHEITCNNSRLFIDGKDKGRQNPNEAIRKILKENKSYKLEGFPTLTGGLVGFFAFDYMKYQEPSIEWPKKQASHFKDVDLMLFSDIICFDHYRQTLMIITQIDAHNIDEDYDKACRHIEEIEHLIKKEYIDFEEPLRLKSEFTSMFTKEEYCQCVEKCKQYIRDGDIFQVVLANRLEATCSGSLLDTYRVLRTTNPSPYMFYFYSDSMEVAGSSPETLVKLTEDELYTFPIAGTRKRGKDAKEDKVLSEDLLHDEKELSEHNMLVDLGRNDLGRVAKMGSVEVIDYKKILKFSKVIHMASVVKGELKEGNDAIDVIGALLPAGTLSGAPKIRACEIINELETVKRGIYGGAIGYLDFNGNMDTCIGIRLAYKKSNKVYVCSGAGIVYDSVPENEYRECQQKASAIVEALQIASGGID
jgi:anthranilate synthase component 1